MLRATMKYWFELVSDPLPFAAQIAQWFFESYSRSPWNEGFHVCPECCPAENPSSGLRREYQHTDENAQCPVHHIPVERFWCERRVRQYLVHLMVLHQEKFVFLGLFDEGGLKGFIWGFPMNIGGRFGLYLDFIFVVREFRRKKGILNAVSVLFLILQYRYFPKNLFAQKICGFFLDKIAIPQVDMMRRFLGEVDFREYRYLFARIISSSSRLRHNVWSVGFNEFVVDSDHNEMNYEKRAYFCRTM